MSEQGGAGLWGNGHRGRAALRMGDRDGRDIKGPPLIRAPGQRPLCVAVHVYFCTCCSEEEAVFAASYFNLSETASDTEGRLWCPRKANAVKILDGNE